MDISQTEHVLDPTRQDGIKHLDTASGATDTVGNQHRLDSNTHPE